MSSSSSSSSASTPSTSQTMTMKRLNVLATLLTRLIEHAMKEIKEFEIPVTIQCIYKAIPENLEDRFSEYHDLIIKRAN
jgi:hypothetical protein